MDEIDEEISFLDEKIKSSRTQAKERRKTSTPVTARDSGIGVSAQRERGVKENTGMVVQNQK